VALLLATCCNKMASDALRQLRTSFEAPKPEAPKPSPSGPAAFQWPRGLILEMTSHCNMHCTFCPSDQLQRTKQHLSDEDAIKFINAAPSLLPGGPWISFCIMGEPLLNKKVFDYIGLCEKLKVGVLLVTNITLLTDENLKKLFSHSNITVILSLHTPSEKSFFFRGYKKISYAQYLDMLCNAIESKFKYGNHNQMQIYLATETDENPGCDGGLPRLWTLFPDRQEYENGFQYCIKRLAALSAEIRQKYPEQVQESSNQLNPEMRKNVESGEIVLDPGKLPAQTDEGTLSGWMLLPNVLLRRKPFSIFRHQPYIQEHLPSDKFAYIEERTEPFVCAEGTTSFGILSNGEYVTCCQDVEGEMEIGNIKTMTPMEALRSKRRADIMANAGVSKVCRRCKGTPFILEKTALASFTQAIDQFGSGFHAPEPDPWGRQGRWTNGNANAYFVARIDASELSISFRSLLPSDTRFELILSRLDDPVKQTFATELHAEFWGVSGQTSDLTIPVQLQRAGFYRLTLVSPSFVPDETIHNGDQRRLGIAVTSIKLVGRPYAEASPGENMAEIRNVLPVLNTATDGCGCNSGSGRVSCH
jgi:radical SAM protein with 4Fe4S-binding SPASM domain